MTCQQNIFGDLLAMLRIQKSPLACICVLILSPLSYATLVGDDAFTQYAITMQKVGVDLECYDWELSARTWRRNGVSCFCDPDKFCKETINLVYLWDFTEDFDGSHPTLPSGYVLSDDDVREIPKFKGIRAAQIWVKVSDDTLETIAGLPELLAVELDMRGPVNQSQLQILSKASKLRTVKIRGNSIADTGLSPLAGLGNLKSLEFVAIDYRFCDSREQTEQVGNELAKLSLLQQLHIDLANTKFPPDLGMIRHLEHLEQVSAPIDESCSGLLELAKLSHLKELRLQPIATRHGSVNSMIAHEPEEIILSRSIANLNDSFGAIAELSSLESLTLDLALCQECDRFTGIADISRIPRLRLLELKSGDQLTGAVLANLTSNSLKEVRIDDCIHFSDKGLVNLAKGTNLKTLTLMNCLEISDEGIRALETMTNLERLEIEYEGGPKPDGLTAEGLRALKEKLPKCFISLRHFSKERGILVDVVSLK